MELIKLSEAYNIIDKTTQGWSVSGQLTKETSGSLHINFSVSGDKHIGNYNYNRGNDMLSANNISVSYNCEAEHQDAFYEYCDALIDQILVKVD